MRFVAAILLCVTLANPAHAWWGHGRHCGYGWCGYGYSGFGLSTGYGGLPYYGGYGPGYCGSGYYGSGYYGSGYYGSGYGAPLGLGYFGYPAYGINYNPAAGYLSYRLPAFHEPAELQFGPQAVKQFLGLPRNFALGALGQPLLPAGNIAADSGAKSKERGAHVSNAEARGKAARHQNQGDELFRDQNFHGALQRYKLAASAAPDLAEPYWRQGHALIATSNFELAAAAFKRAIALSDDLARGGFQLDQIYNGAQMSKARHLESLSAWALAHEVDADPYFLLGVFLSYDGGRERSEKFFQRAADLAGNDGGHIAAFLAPAPTPPAPAPVPAPPAALAPRALPVASGTEI